MVETPLVADQLKAIDQILKVAEEHLKWDDGIFNTLSKYFSCLTLHLI